MSDFNLLRAFSTSCSSLKISYAPPCHHPLPFSSSSVCSTSLNDVSPSPRRSSLASSGLSLIRFRRLTQKTKSKPEKLSPVFATLDSHDSPEEKSEPAEKSPQTIPALNGVLRRTTNPTQYLGNHECIPNLSSHRESSTQYGPPSSKRFVLIGALSTPFFLYFLPSPPSFAFGEPSPASSSLHPPSTTAIDPAKSSNPGSSASSRSSPSPSFITLDDGLKILDIREGGGATPVSGDKVSVHYYARLGSKQGWRFDSTLDHKDSDGNAWPFEFALDSPHVIRGLSIGVRSMKVGGVRRLVIPPSLGYQSESDQPIPPDFFDRQRLYTTIFNQTRIRNGEGSTLGTVIFDVQLLGIRPS